MFNNFKVRLIKSIVTDFNLLSHHMLYLYFFFAAERKWFAIAAQQHNRRTRGASGTCFYLRAHKESFRSNLRATRDYP